jgi:hypothetical protein
VSPLMVVSPTMAFNRPVVARCWFSEAMAASFNLSRMDAHMFARYASQFDVFVGVLEGLNDLVNLVFVGLDRRRGGCGGDSRAESGWTFDPTSMPEQPTLSPASPAKSPTSRR